MYLGPVVQNLTMLLVNDSLKFQMAILQIPCIFFFFLKKKNVRILCNAKDSHILSTKNNSVFANVVFMFLAS